MCVCFVLKASTHGVYNGRFMAPPLLSLFLLTVLMKEKAATTFLKGHMDTHTEISQKYMLKKTQTRQKEREKREHYSKQKHQYSARQKHHNRTTEKCHAWTDQTLVLCDVAEQQALFLGPESL